jgi:hypothetical protein
MAKEIVPTHAQGRALLDLLDAAPKCCRVHRTTLKNLVSRGWAEVDPHYPTTGRLTEAGREMAERLRVELLANEARSFLMNVVPESQPTPPVPVASVRKNWRELMLTPPSPFKLPTCGHIDYLCPECRRLVDARSELSIQVTLLQHEREHLDRELTRIRQVAEKLLDVVKINIEEP